MLRAPVILHWDGEKMDSIGLYIHVPFCVKKCGYCDFYSVTADEDTMDAYTRAMCDKLSGMNGDFTADTVYFGGGTPSVLGGRRIAEILKAAYPNIAQDAEITTEANPGDELDEFFAYCADAGVNRVSLGMQSAVDGELALLTRRHTVTDVERAVSTARKRGINNISLDLMVGIEGQNEISLMRSVDYCAALGVDHVSAYMLKIEDGTPFAARRDRSAFADEDRSADLYIAAVERLAAHGYEQYEISNFARNGAVSRHNLKYWNCEPYIGIGPAAHSFYGGRRFFYPRSLADFIADVQPTDDGSGGDFDEYAMLRLRLTDGLRRDMTIQRFPDCDERYAEMVKRAEKYAGAGLCTADGERIALNSHGFLLSNSIICDLLAD